MQWICQNFLTLFMRISFFETNCWRNNLKRIYRKSQKPSKIINLYLGLFLRASSLSAAEGGVLTGGSSSLTVTGSTGGRGRSCKLFFVRGGGSSGRVLPMKETNPRKLYFSRIVAFATRQIKTTLTKITVQLRGASGNTEQIAWLVTEPRALAFGQQIFFELQHNLLSRLRSLLFRRGFFIGWFR